MKVIVTGASGMIGKGVFIKYLKWLIILIKKLAPDTVVDSTQIGRAMINVTRHGYENNVLKPGDILILADNPPGKI